MLQTISTVHEKEESGLYDYLCRRRYNAAKIFPHDAEAADDYIERINGCKLSKASIQALKRD